MTQEEFDKAPLLDQILYDETGMLVKNNKDIAEAMEKYHQAKIKLLGIDDVSKSLDLVKLELKIDEALDNETSERLKKWLHSKRL